MRAEFDRFVGAAPYERTAARRGQRNGSYARTLKTRVGALVLEVPRDRAGQFRSSLFAKYERSEQALVLATLANELTGHERPMLLSTLAVPLIYLVAKRIFGRRTALAAAALFAFSPFSPSRVPVTIRCPVEDTGMNSVRPSTIPITMAIQINPTSALSSCNPRQG